MTANKIHAMKKSIKVSASFFCLIAAMPSYSDNHYPVTIKNCGQTLTFDSAPKRAAFNDLNITELALAVGLQPHMVAISGISGWYKTDEQFNQQVKNIKEISPRYLALEPLLSVQPDFLFAGWNYGLRMGTELTPENLSRFGIKTLILSESCVHAGENLKNASMNLLYDDALKLGKIFNRSSQASTLVANWKNQLNDIAIKVADKPKKKVFLYDSGIDKPLTSGRFAMPQALIEAAGGENIMNKNDFSWNTTSWESVALYNPDLIVLVDYNTLDGMGPEQSKKVLESHPLMKHTQAVKNKNYLLLRYSEITPGPRNIDAVKKLAAKLYPDSGIAIDVNS